MEQSDDTVLVKRMLKGEERAFEEFFSTYFDRLYRFALARLADRTESAEDAVQQTLCRAIEKLHQFRGEAALYTWLCQICRNTISDLYRTNPVAGMQTVPFEDSIEVRAALETLSALSTADPQLAMQNEQLGRLVRVVLDHLPKRYADALDWKYIQGLSVDEIALRLAITAKAAESVLSRARAAFREGVVSLGREEALGSTSW